MKQDQLNNRVYRFIQHSVMLSKTKNYQKLRFLSALDKCIEISAWIKRFDYNGPKTELSKIVLRNRENLHRILPSTLNNSYEGSLKALTEILDEASATLNPEKQIISTINQALSSHAIQIQNK